tara:strand:+ start:2269 stop:2985 length:717 start_codon:yes stop_codon:yes gene_type:complete
MNYSKNGRNGDTKLMLTSKGDVEHINSFEQYVKDNNIRGGENWVKRHGSRTINPKDGLTENSWISNLFRTGKLDVGDDLDSLSNLWDSTIGKEGIGSFFRDTSSSGYEDIVEKGTESIKAQADAKFGEGGYFESMEKIADRTTESSFNQMNKNVSDAKSKVGFATSGSLEEAEGFMYENVAMADITQDKKLTNEQLDLKMSLRNQLNRLFTDYASLAEEPYKGADDLYDDFDEWTRRG